MFGNIKRVLVLKSYSYYDALVTFADYIVEGFRENGIIADVLIDNQIITQEAGNDGMEYDLLFDFNGQFIGIEKLLGRWENAIHWCFLVDAPYYHDNVLKMAEGDHYWVSCVDYKQCLYGSQYYLNLKNWSFMPHGGILLNKNIKRLSERSRNIVFMGSYATYQEEKLLLDAFPKYLKNGVNDMYDLMCHGTDKSFHELVTDVFETANFHVDGKEFREFLNYIQIIEYNMRSAVRLKVIEVLANAGLDIDIYGRGWEQLEQISEHIHIHKEIGFMESLEIMHDTKVVLNVLPLFKAGSHERVFNSMLSGAVCVTDSNQYLQEEFKDEEELLFLQLNDIASVVEKIKFIIVHPDEAQHIADAGRKKVLQKHTWKHRVDDILADIKEMM